MQRCFFWSAISWTALLGLALLAACSSLTGQLSPTSTVSVGPRQIPPTVLVTDPPVNKEPSLEPSVAAAWEKAEVLDAGIEFEVPGSWQPVGEERLWSPGGSNPVCLGLNWQEIEPGQEVEPLFLPNHAQVLDSQAISQGQVMGRRYQVEVYSSAAQGGQVQAVETHVIFRASGRRAYDLYLRGASLADVSVLDPLLEHVIETVQIAP